MVRLKSWGLESKPDEEEWWEKSVLKKKERQCCRLWCHQKTLRIVSQWSKSRCGRHYYDKLWKYVQGTGWLRSRARYQWREGSWESDRPAYEKGHLFGAEVTHDAGSVEWWGRRDQGLPQLSIQSLYSKHLLLPITVACQANQRIFIECLLFSQHFISMHKCFNRCSRL